ncbi:ABC transporter substrate-binding protein [Burkholderia oklahomensis]|uniref:Bacterial extracellular solute-binding family protein n=1 Tax=Burkholderia oklahomensis TaxID=342113 RepID=A0AAI8B6C9_9BURK|nr:sugar ABC transporter substrate-binding protein [Burkholderia oklahomensis]AIO66383.1 bacterial extracellular solute-binding family protein [Burkholderia oklahomensis]AJX33460.1 bacterial extracellular solute-binding family protein [Burkholderia oklahomensis C6786]AOI43247.1 bicyclomycin resistance protein [Burkholderia oklahomensis EO147]AOI46820.1 bicyclomycin resistance protein [Burkholderia oklahomensis C6786]KUY47527.1 bicyclomycin resistance protein [Burkholderia oklahomensis EO147]
MKPISIAFRNVVAALAVASAAANAHADTIRVTVAHYSDATAPYFETMARNFEKANPGTTVKIEDVNWDTLQQKLQTDISGGANADLAIVGTRWLLDFVKDDVAEPLDGYMDANFKNRFIGPFLAPGEIGGKVYGLPVAGSARALYYNKTLLTKVGYPNGPKTWNDVIDASKKLKAMGIAGFGQQGKEIETDVYFYYALWSYGGDVVGKDGKAAFNSPAGVKAATMYKTMIDEGLTEPGVTGYSREDVQNLFKQGRVAMVISAPFLSKQIKKEAPNLKYGIDPIPMGTVRATYAVTDSIVMFKNSKVKKSAWKFLDYLFTKEPRVKFTSTEGFLPTTKAESADPAFNDPDTKAFVALLPTARFAPTVTGWEDTAKAVSDAMQAIYLGKAQPAAALNAAATKANGALGK